MKEKEPLGITGLDDISNNVITFNTDPVTEILRLENNGDIYIRGKLAENDKEVVNALRDFLNDVGYINKK